MRNRTRLYFSIIKINGYTAGSMRALCWTSLVFATAVIVGRTSGLFAQSGEVNLPHIERVGQRAQLIVGGKPFLILGGELGNSSASTAAEADEILPGLARAHVNTVLIPVPWEEIEPEEGHFDFAVLDHWIERAHEQQMHLVLLWFGSWKNGVSSYTPGWVKADSRRFPRAIGADGQPLEVLSTLAESNVQADAKAFRSLMRHVREVDAGKDTVLMVQVENEVGLIGATRDRSAVANRAFKEQVPPPLLNGLRARRLQLAPEVAMNLSEATLAKAGTWSEVFGKVAPEIFMAWHYATYVQGVASAGKDEYALPMFTNAQLPAPKERAGDYPSGGPHAGMLDVWKAGAPVIYFFSPDIYWPEFAYWVDRFTVDDNPGFVPEARLESGPWNAFYAFGEAGEFGFSPFAIDSLVSKGKPEQTDKRNPELSEMAQAYGALQELTPLLPAAQVEGRVRGVVLHANSPRAFETVSLGGRLFHVELARTWPARTLAQDDGALLVLQTGEKEFLLAGSAVQVTVTLDPDAASMDAQAASGLSSVEEGTLINGVWTAGRRLNGDQTNQGRSVSLPAHSFQVLRVKVY